MPVCNTSKPGKSEVTTIEQIAALFKGSKPSDGGLSNVRAAPAVESVGTSDALGRNSFKNALHWPKACSDESESAICKKLNMNFHLFVAKNVFDVLDFDILANNQAMFDRQICLPSHKTISTDEFGSE
jgi:hypothetical protein